MSLLFTYNAPKVRVLVDIELATISAATLRTEGYHQSVNLISSLKFICCLQCTPADTYSLLVFKLLLERGHRVF